MSKAETPEKRPNIDDMTFGEAFNYCQRNNMPEITWRGQYYAVDTVSDVAEGFRRQADIDREQKAMGEHMADALMYGMGMTRTRIDPKDFYMGVDMAKPDAERTATNMRPFRVAYDRALARIDHLDRVIADLVEKNQRLERSMEREDPGNADIDAPIVGRMISDKPVDQLRIERQVNGGWLVEGRKGVRDDYMTRPDLSGAFTSTADMLRALADLLERDDEKRKEAQDG